MMKQLITNGKAEPVSGLGGKKADAGFFHPQSDNQNNE